MAFSMASGGPSRPQINVNPLIDVLLVLIIIFMVVQSMSKDKGVNTQLPQPAMEANQAPSPDRTIVIQLVWSAEDQDQPPELKINQENVSWDDLHSRLHDIFKQRGERVAFVRGDGDVDFEYIANVIDIARDAGVDRVGLLTTQE